MANLVDWLSDFQKATNEEVTHIVIGDMGWPGYDNEPGHGYEEVPTWHEQDAIRYKVIPYNEEARRLINYTFDSGYGAPGCNAITAWTKNYIFAIAQYDGATAPFYLPRNPTDHKPKMPGG